MLGSRVVRLRRFDQAQAIDLLLPPARAAAAELRRRLPLVLITGAVVSLAGTLLARGTPSGPAPPPLLFLAWVLLAGVTELAPLKLPRGGFLTMSSAFDLAAVVLFGPLAAAWIAVTSSAVVHGAVRPRPPFWLLAQLAAGVLAAFAAGGFFQALGGRFGTLALTAPDLAAFAGMGFTYFGVRTILPSLLTAAQLRESPWPIWQLRFGWALAHLGGLLAIAALAALAHTVWGFPALLLLVGPLLLARRACALELRQASMPMDFAAALVGALEAVDPTTKRHSIRVARYAERLARGLGLPETDVRAIRLAGLLHDVGKLAQERALLQKPGPLDADEKRRIEAHPVAGAEIVGCMPDLRLVAALVRHHHERPDGGGYPARLRGEAIPLGSRVVLVADAFDAMTSDRPYRRGMSSERALDELSRHAGRQFDSRVVATLARLRARGDFDLLDSENGDSDLRPAV